MTELKQNGNVFASMKTLSQCLVTTCFIIALLTGCKNPEVGAYKTLGSIAITVNASKKAFEDYRSKHPVSADVEATAKRTYQSYQRLMAVAEVAQKQFSSGGDKTVWENAFASVVASGNDFLALVRIYIPKTPTI